MPKTWEKSYQWILDKKTVYDEDYQKLREKVNEIEDQNEKALIQITNDIKNSRKELKNENDNIIDKTQEVEIQKKDLKNSIKNSIKHHKEHSKKQKDLRTELNEKEKLIVKNKIRLKCNDQMIKHEQDIIHKLEQINVDAKSKEKEIRNNIKGKQTQKVLEEKIDNLNSEIEKSSKSKSNQYEIINFELDQQTKNSEKLSKSVSDIYNKSKDQYTELIDKNKSSLNKIKKVLNIAKSIPVPDSSTIENDFETLNDTLHELEK